MVRDSQQTQTLLKVFETLGVPLVGAVDELIAWQQSAAGPDAPPPASEEFARRFAELLSSSIKLGNMLTAHLDPASAIEAEQARLMASSLGARLVAQHYILTGQTPDDQFRQHVSNAFNAVLSLADQVGKPAPNTATAPTDMVTALTPLVLACLRFPFGQDTGVFINNLGRGLFDRIDQLEQAFMGPETSQLGHAGRFDLVHGCAKILAKSCELEIDRIDRALSLGQIRDLPAPDVMLGGIWKRFDDGTSVLRAVLGFLTPEVQTRDSAQTGGPTVAAPVTPAIVPQKTNQAVAAPVKPKAEAGSSQPAASPMSFFVKKPVTGDQAGTGT